MRQILWRHRCAELYRAFINDPAKSGLVGEQSHHLRHERLEERIVLSAPTIDQVENFDNLELNQVGEYSVELTGIDNGTAGDVLTITATSSDLTVATNPLIVHVPGATTATLSFNTLLSRGTSTITVSLNNGIDPVTTMMFDVTVPLAVDNFDSTTEGATTTGNLLTNDNAELGESLSVSSITVGLTTFPVDQMGMDTEIEVPGMGLLTVNMDGSYTFDPQDDFQSLNDGSMTTISFDYEVVATDILDMVAATETGTLSITITGVNDPPTIDLDADDSSGAVGTGYQGTFLAGEAAVAAVDSDLVITDLDHTELQSATITLNNPQDGMDGADETLGITVPMVLPIGVSVDTSDPHVITITGPVSITDLQTWLETLTYQNLAATPTTGVRTITIEVSDGTASAMATSMMTVLLSSDLAISASGTPSSAIAGETITYTITATNNGPNDATGVRVVGLLPAGTTFDSETHASGTTYDAGTWTIGDLASGASVELTLTVLVDPSLADGSMVVNTGTIETTNVAIADSVSGNNSLNESTDVSRQAELGIAVSGPTLVAAEAEITYTITLTNSGPSDASNITVNVPVPTGTTYDAGNTMIPAGTMYDQTDWVIPSLAAGESVFLTLIVDVNSGLVLGPGNELSLTATIAAFDESAAEVNDPDDNSATLETNVLEQTDVSVTITDSPDPVTPGGTVTYTVTFTNNGIDEVTSLQVMLGIDSDLNNIMYIEGAGTFNSGTGNWTGLSLATGEMVTLTITGDVDPGVTIDPVNPELSLTATLARVNGDSTPDDDSTNDSATETTEVLHQVDVSVAISDSPDPVTPNGNVTYTVTFTNEGIDTVSSLQVDLALPPANFGNVMYSPSTGSFDPGTGNFTGLNLATGETVTLTITGVVNPAITIDPDNPELSLTATLTEVNGDATPDDNSANDTETETTEVRLLWDVSVEITELTDDPIAPGGTVIYQVTFTNQGVSSVSTLRVNLLGIGSLTSKTYVVMHDGMLGSFNSANGDLTLPLGHMLVSGDSVTLTITGTVPANITINPDAPEITFTANLTRINNNASLDQFAGNNSDTETTNVSFENDLAVTVLTSPDPSIAGEEQTFTITVVNEGLEAVTGVVVDIPLPAGVTFVSDDSGGSYDPNTGIWTVGDLDITSVEARTATLTLVVLIDADYSPATLELEAMIVVSNGDDPHDDENDANDSASITTNVDHKVDVAVSMTGPSTADAGGPVTYTVTVTNDGPSQATGIVVLVDVDDISKIESLTVQGSSNPGLDPGDIVVDDAARSITFTVGTLNPGESITLTYEAEVDGDASVDDMFTITATLTEVDQADMSNLDDMDEVLTTIDRMVDLSLTAVGPVTVVAGQDIVYELQLDNLGPSNANNLVVIFTLPTITNDVNNWVTIDPLVVSTGSITEQMIDDGLGGMIPTGNWLWTVPSLTADAAPATLTYTFSTNVLIKGIDNIFVDFSAHILSGQEDPPDSGNDSAFFHTNVLNAAPTANNGNGQGDEDDVAGTVEVDLLTLASDDQTSADPAIADAVLNFQIVNQGSAILTDANGPHNAAGYLQGTAAVVGSDLVYTYSGNIDGLRDGDVLTQVITYRAIDSAGQFTDRTVTIQITGQNDAPTIETLISPDANEANAITIKGTFNDLDRALGAGEDIHVLSVSVTAPIGHPFEVVPGSTIIAFNAVTGKYSFWVDVIFHDDAPTGSPSDPVMLEFEIDDQIITATGEREVTVNNLPPSITDYETDVQLSTLGELVIPITLSDPSALDTLSVSVNRVAENDDVYETAVTNSNDPGDLVVWNPSAMDPRKGELIVRYNANDFDGLSFTLRIVVTDDDTGVSSIVQVNATVPAGLGFLPVTPDPEEPTAPAPLPFNPPPIPESTNTISLPDNVQRALAPPAKGETVALELRIVWNYGEPDEWQEKIRELIAKDRKELQEKLQELSELLQGLPDNQYRAFLVRGDGTENQLMEVRIREGKIVELKQQEAPSFTPGPSDVSSEPTAPEPMPGEPMSRLEGAFPSRNSGEPHELENTAADPFARFGRASHIEAWQSVYRARAASVIDN